MVEVEWDTMVNKQAVALTAGEPTFDIVDCGSFMLPEYVPGGMYEDISDLFPPEVKAKYMDGMIDSVTVDGKVYAAALAPLDRKHASFVSQGGASFGLPAAWEGKTDGSAEGNPAMADGKPVWRLDQVWPANPEAVASYRPLVWRNGWWVAPGDGFGGQPKAELKDRGVRLEFRAKHGKPAAERICGAIERSKPEMRVKFILMNSSGVGNVDGSDEHLRSVGQHIVLWLLEVLLPPMKDNIRASHYFSLEVGEDNPYVEWCTVRPDSLIDEAVTEYELYPGLIKGLFEPSKTSRANVAHFMCELLDAETWQKWKFKLPYIINKNQ